MQRKQRDFVFEIKSIDEKGVFSGYGSVFGVTDSHNERVLKGAFLASLARHAEKNTMPLMFYNHSSFREIGEWLEMREDEHGLFVSGRLWIDGPNPDPDALKAYRGMTKQRGKMGLSIGYSVPEGGAGFNSALKTTDLVTVDLWEVSPVVFPANDEARIDHVRNDITTIRDLERFLRDAGLSRSQAAGVAAKGFAGLGQGEPDFELLQSAKALLNTLKA